MTDLQPRPEGQIASLQQQLMQKCMESASYWDGMQQLNETLHTVTAELASAKEECEALKQRVAALESPPSLKTVSN